MSKLSLLGIELTYPTSSLSQSMINFQGDSLCFNLNPVSILPTNQDQKLKKRKRDDCFNGEKETRIQKASSEGNLKKIQCK